MTYYLDSSVALRAVLEVPERPRVLRWLDDRAGQLVSSRLLRTEIVRVLRREQLPVSAAAALLSRVGLISLSDEVASVAESIERHVKTLDALHLATALVIGDPVVVVTHDAGMAAVAGHLGLDVEDPVA
ncbi:type II toxin-antitoxin system VapC family toxin [Cellulomonas sp. IC4_254]|uniref:type II toxin-antitoxin system VapC family toxin n=1 Tax=Cellulomonas sp. IC4_254 TaxID=2714040 RepID=UPI001422D4CC|nr:type II toxin-antitoxin system VapC family toxin [Cellulomonas sp. IC4_254]NHT16310.1 type II toxin-antitoxin system VapC family toxin [Cellulomonas sp. IC4_254]